MFSIAILFAILPISGTSGFAFFLYLIFGSWHGYQAYHGNEYQMGWVTSLLAALNGTDTPEVPPLTPTVENTPIPKENAKK